MKWPTHPYPTVEAKLIMGLIWLSKSVSVIQSLARFKAYIYLEGVAPWFCCGLRLLLLQGKRIKQTPLAKSAFSLMYACICQNRGRFRALCIDTGRSPFPIKLQKKRQFMAKKEQKKTISSSAWPRRPEYVRETHAATPFFLTPNIPGKASTVQRK